MPGLLPTTTLRALLRTGAATVPTVRLAVGVTAVASAAALAARGAGPMAAVLGGAAVVGGMTLLVVLSRLTSPHDTALRASLVAPAIVLVWTAVVAIAIVLALMISTTFWGRPASWEAVAARTRVGRTATTEVRPDPPKPACSSDHAARCP